MTSQPRTTESFDPQSPAEWQAMREMGHRMVDDMFSALQSLPAAPVWRSMPDAVRDAFTTPVPEHGRGNADAYRLFCEHVLPYGSGNWHPRFFGWVQGQGTPLAMLSDLLASGMNPHLGGFNQAPALVERQVVSWFAALLGMPSASGLMVTGGTMANTHGIAVARFAAARTRGRDVRRDGVQHWPGTSNVAPLVFYGSQETHGWARKAAEWLGLGNRAFRRVPVLDDFTMDLSALAQLIAADRRAGLDPFCVMGTAGTVNTGATDDLEGIATLCARERLWFHVDGAFGALTALAPSLRSQVRGMERADSIAFDLHKWGSMPFECAMVLVRDADLHLSAFQTSASYLAETPRGVSAGGYYFADRGLDLTRSFKALKVWMQLHADGARKFGRIIEQNVRQVQQLVALVDAHDSLEMMAPAPLNIACFRFRSPELAMQTADAVDGLNRELLLRLHERGIAIPSSTILHDRFALRVAHVNHRTTDDDIVMMLDAIVAIGRELVEEIALERQSAR